MSASNKLIQAAAGVGGEEADADFANTVLLLNADDASNGGQNNTFLDSSSNTHTLTRNGNVTQGSFSPFSVDDGKWGNYFDGSGDYLKAADNAAFDLSSGDWTIEGWFYLNSVPSAAMVVGNADRSLGTGGFGVVITSTDLRLVGNSNSQGICTVTWQANTWYHFAIIRSGTGANSSSIYLNGVKLTPTGNGAGDPTFASTTVGPYIGSDNGPGDYFSGYISNIRIIKGSSAYGANPASITVPTSPLTAISGTSLLTCQSNRFVDNSSNAHSITVNGDTKVVPFSPFPQTTAYDASQNGGSGYFDGSGDYLTVPATTDFAMGTGDFTVDGWVYWNGLQTKGLFHIGTSHLPSVTKGIAIGSNNTNKWRIYTGQGDTNSTTNIIPYQWQHFAYVRNSGTVKLYVDGTEVISVSDNRNHTYQYLAIGGYFSTSFLFNGYLSNLRIIKGTALYTSSFTPPASLTTEVSGTSFIGNFTNASVFDATGKNVLETVGSAQIDTTNKKYGTGSMEFDGNGDYLAVAPQGLLSLGAGDFTMEAWIYMAVTPSNMVIASSQNYFTSGFDGNWLWRITNTYELTFASYDGTSGLEIADQNVPTMALNTWHHVAIVRSGTTITMYLNGTAGSPTDTSSRDLKDSGVSGIFIGEQSLNNEFTGYIDDFRITKGIARYTANFTPPEAALPVIGEE